MLFARQLFERKEKGLIKIQQAFSEEVVAVAKTLPKSLSKGPSKEEAAELNSVMGPYMSGDVH